MPLTRIAQRGLSSVLSDLNPKAIVAIAERIASPPQCPRNSKRDVIEVAVIFGAVALGTIAFWALAGVGAWWLLVGRHHS
jgi:hypothetical protein